MYVRNERDMDALFDLFDRRRGRLVEHGDTDDLTARVFEAQDLPDRRVDVARVRIAHRLHGYRRAAADLYVSDLYEICHNDLRINGSTE